MSRVFTIYKTDCCWHFTIPISSIIFPFEGEVTWSEDTDDSTLVAVKMLKQDASRETQEDFVREVKVMCAFSHPNILSLLGIVKWGRYNYLRLFDFQKIFIKVYSLNIVAMQKVVYLYF